MRYSNFAAVVAVLGACGSALATVVSGTVSRTEQWQVSPGGQACPWAWQASWVLDTNNNVMTISQTVRLNAAAGSAAITAAELNNWETKIENAWNNGAIYITCFDPSSGQSKNFTARYDITLSTTAATSDATVTVTDGNGGTNAANWFRTGGSGVNVASLNVAAHEIGHLLGVADEYTNGGCIIPGSVWNGLAFTTTSLMNNTNLTGADVPVGRTQPRHYLAWELAFANYDLGKGLNNIYAVIPTPGVLVIAPVAGLFASRRRRA